jgi:hypothetical protein
MGREEEERNVRNWCCNDSLGHACKKVSEGKREEEEGWKRMGRRRKSGGKEVRERRREEGGWKRKGRRRKSGGREVRDRERKREGGK